MIDDFWAVWEIRPGTLSKLHWFPLGVVAGPACAVRKSIGRVTVRRATAIGLCSHCARKITDDNHRGTA